MDFLRHSRFGYALNYPPKVWKGFEYINKINVIEKENILYTFKTIQ